MIDRFLKMNFLTYGSTESAFFENECYKKKNCICASVCAIIDWLSVSYCMGFASVPEDNQC